MDNFEIGRIVGGLALGIGGFAIFALICLTTFILNIVGKWKCFVKMGDDGWASIIPIYNIWVLCKHTWGDGAMMLIWLIPFVGSVFSIITYWKMFRGFGKGILFSLFGVIFQPIAMCICAFDKSTYSHREK